MLRPGCLLDIRKADLEGTPSQNSLRAAHVPQGAVSFHLEHRIGFNAPRPGACELRPAACVGLGADEPNLEAEKCRTLFMTKCADDETRSSVEMTSGKQ